MIKYQIFISSTYQDLSFERHVITKAILDMGHIPVGMEMFPATDQEQMFYIKKIIDECDYYILIIGARYGSIDNYGISYTEREYQYAIDVGKPVLAFIHGNIESIPFGKTDKDIDKFKSLEKFISTVKSGRLVQYWNNADQLSAKAIVAISNAIANKPAVGWVRAIDDKFSNDSQKYIDNLKLENHKLIRENKITKTRLKMFTDDKIADVGITIKYIIKWSNMPKEQHDQSFFKLPDLFYHICPILHSGTSIDEIKYAIECYIEKINNNKFTVKKCEIIDLKEDIIQKILLKFVDYGDVEIYIDDSFGTKNYNTGYRLTEKGTKFWVRLSR